MRQLTSGQDNEVWSFGEDNYEILKKYLFIRERCDHTSVVVWNRQVKQVHR